MQHPGPGRTTKPLNTGLTTNATGIVIGWAVYATPAGQTTGYVQVAPFNTFATSAVIFAANNFPNSIGPAPVSNTAGVLPPAAPTVSSPGAGFVPAGTYQIAVTWFTSMGQTILSSASAITVNGSQNIRVSAPASTAPTAFVLVDLGVPRLEDWHCTRIATVVGSPVSTPQVDIFVDTVSPINFLDGTLNATKFSSLHDTYLRGGEHLLALFQFVDTGGTVTLSCYGEKTS